MGQGVSLLLQEHLLLAKGQKNNEKDHTSRAIYHDLFFPLRLEMTDRPLLLRYLRFICNQSLVIILTVLMM